MPIRQAEKALDLRKEALQILVGDWISLRSNRSSDLPKCCIGPEARLNAVWVPLGQATREALLYQSAQSGGPFRNGYSCISSVPRAGAQVSAGTSSRRLARTARLGSRRTPP